MNKTKEANLVFAKMSVQGLLMAKDALNGYAHNLKGVERDECPIVVVDEEHHGEIADFITGQQCNEWECPFCKEQFESW